MTLAHYTSWKVPWGPLSLALTVGATWLTARGVRLSTTAVGIAIVAQVAVMVVVCGVVLVQQRHHLSSAPFSWGHLSGGLTGLSAGFPLALYMFIGWENGPALAEECRTPRKSVPRALFISIAIGVVLFVLFAYATVTGFHDKVSGIGRSSVPFLTVADHALGGGAVVAWIGGVVSVLAALVAGSNSQARMLFDGGRQGLLPRWLGRVRARVDTPVNALMAMVVIGLGVIAVWGISHMVGVGTGSMNPVGLYAECSTMGTIVILVVYLLTALSLPVFMWRRHRAEFSGFRHAVVPALGSVTLVVPFVELCKPGQPAPYDVFPFVGLGLVALAMATAGVVVHRRRSTGSSEGTAVV
jgi:amino acid transporter